MKKILSSLALCAFIAPLLVGCNKGPESDNNTPGNVDDYNTPSTLTPGEHKAKLEDIAVEFIGYVDLADFEDILDALYCLAEYLGYDKEDWYGDEYAYNELALGIKNLSPIHFQRFATRALEEVIIDINDPEYNPLAGYVYEWNGDEWEESKGQSHTIVVKWDDAVATASWGETTRQEWTFRELEKKTIVYVPNSLTLNVKIDNKEHLNIVAKPNITDSKTLAPSVEVSLNGGYLISASVKADSRGLETHSSIKKGNKTLLNANTVVAINDFTDIDNWLKTEGEYFADQIKSGKVQIDILNLSIVGAGDFKDLLTDIDEIIEDLYDDEYDAERWRRKMEDVCDLVNEKVKLIIAYNDTDEKVADIVLQVSRDDEDYYVEPILLFPDGSKYAFENYFTETAFGDLIDAIEELADDFEDMMESL